MSTIRNILLGSFALAAAATVASAPVAAQQQKPNIPHISLRRCVEALVFLPFVDCAPKLPKTRLNVTHHQAPISALTLSSLLVDSLAELFKCNSQSVDFILKIIVDSSRSAKTTQLGSSVSFANRRSVSRHNRAVHLAFPHTMWRDFIYDRPCLYHAASRR